MGMKERQKGSTKRKKHDFQKDLDDAILRFQAAFELIQVTDDMQMKRYYFETLEKELNLLDDVIKGVDRKGIRKQESLLSKDAKAYILDQNQENLDKLTQDIATLKEANRVPKNISQ